MNTLLFYVMIKTIDFSDGHRFFFEKSDDYVSSIENDDVALRQGYGTRVT
jgi:hypothetical protein